MSPSIQGTLLSQANDMLSSTTSGRSKGTDLDALLEWEAGLVCQLSKVTFPHRTHQVPPVFHLPKDRTQLWFCFCLLRDSVPYLGTWPKIWKKKKKVWVITLDCAQGSLHQKRTSHCWYSGESDSSFLLTPPGTVKCLSFSFYQITS